MSLMSNAAFTATIVVLSVSRGVALGSGKIAVHVLGQSPTTAPQYVDVTGQPECPGTKVPWQTVQTLSTTALIRHVSCQRKQTEEALNQLAGKSSIPSIPSSQLDQFATLSQQLITYAEALVTRCQFISAGMAAASVEMLDASEHVASFFQRLQELERPVKDAHVAVRRSIDVLEPLVALAATHKSDLEDVVEQLQSADDILVDSLMSAVRGAHKLAASFQKSGHPPLPCAPNLLKGIRDFALEASAASDAEADADFGLATHLSESVVAGSNVPCFGDTVSLDDLGRDSQGHLVPLGLVSVEDMLLRAEEGSFESDHRKRRLGRAMRLYEHAAYLAREGGYNAAAEWRYAQAASLAASNGQREVAAQILARFSSYFVTRGQRREALDQADAAVALYSEEPLGRYLQLSLRLTSGYFQTADSIREAALQIRSLAGLLPGVAYEAERKAWEVDLAMWDVALDGGSTWSQCTAFHDAAKFLICIAGKLLT